MRHFNTTGPVNMPDHYKIDPLSRWNLNEILELIERKKYFILHAPRQTGKTSCLMALRDYLNTEGKYFAVYVNVENAQACLYDVNMGMHSIIDSIRGALAKQNIDNEITESITKMRKADDSGNRLVNILEYICSVINKPVVLLFDEIDALIGETLISVLRQLRSGYPNRPNLFPSTVVLCGVRDLKDYRIHTSTNEIVTGGSAFNIKAVSLRLGNFTKGEVINLYTQHTADTGQIFDETCFDLIMDYTDGQPWLVNSLADEATSRMRENRDRSIVITPKILAEAKERVILERQTHLDQLTDKLSEERVSRVILPIIMGIETEPIPDDVEYCIDLGIIKKDQINGLTIANKIYQEIIPRVMTESQQYNFYARFKPNWLDDMGRIDTNTMLSMFKDFWCKNSDIWGTNIPGYKHAAPQLVLQAFLQRVINGGGNIAREYALGTRRTDLFIEWQYKENDKTQIQNIVIEIKTIDKKQKYETLRDETINQTLSYAKKCKTNEAHIIIFDRENHQNWGGNTENEFIKLEGVNIQIWKLGSEE